MKKADFDNLFRDYWKREYPLPPFVSKNDLHAADDIIQDINEMSQVKIYLLKYAQQAQECGCLRRLALILYSSNSATSRNSLPIERRANSSLLPAEKLTPEGFVSLDTSPRLRYNWA